MRIGVPKEIKNHEYRVGLTPGSVRELVHHGHQVLVQSEAGAGIGMHDSRLSPPAQIVADAAAVFARRDGGQGQGAAGGRNARLRAGQILFTYLHLAPDPVQAGVCLKSGAPPSPTKPSPTRAAPCPCSHR
jgi:alanine dehydrogenase